VSEATVTIGGLHCGACVKRIQNALAPLAASVNVTLEPPSARVIDATVSADEIILAITGAGKYTVERPRAPRASVTDAAAPTAISNTPLSTSWLTTYRPLLLILAYLLVVTALIQAGEPRGFNTDTWMRHFMAGFFLVFSFFKLLDLGAFANAYADYDLLAKRWHGWGLCYPFIELAFGLAYLTNFMPIWTNTAAFVVMTFSAIGVILAVLKKQQIRCACLGAVFNLPMSTVTIVEDVAMAAMAGWMLLR
jgi:copper chaperone CopZ